MQRSIMISIACIAIVALLLSAGTASKWDPPRAQPVRQVGSITFAVISDYGTCSTHELNVANVVKGWNPAFIVTAGDNWQGSVLACPNYYASSVAPYYGDYVTAQAFWPVLGNHDYQADLARYRAYFSYLPTADNAEQRFYDVVQGDVRFFMIDSVGALNSPSDMEAQKSWLQGALAASESTWNIVVFHYTAYSSSPKHGSTIEMQWPFAQWGADLVIAGHNHVYERVLQDGIRYLTDGLGGESIYTFGTPVSGSEVRYNANNGAVRITASSTTMTIEFLSIDNGGEVRDSFTLTQEPTPTPTGTVTPTDGPRPTGTPTATPGGDRIWLPLIADTVLSSLRTVRGRAGHLPSDGVRMDIRGPSSL